MDGNVELKPNNGLTPAEKKVYSVALSILLIALILLGGVFFFPGVTQKILSVLWIALLSLVVCFVSVGILVILGLRKEANQILDLFLQGSLSIIDFVNFLKLVWQFFLTKVKEFLIAIAPFFSFTIAFGLYLGILAFYKWIGRSHDVTLMTIVVTVFMISVVSLFNQSVKRIADNDWLSQFKFKVKKSFADACEVIVMIFFLTMDSTQLFFLPINLRVPIHAEFGAYNFMLRGYSINMTKTTLTIIMIAIVSEIIRNLLRLIILTYRYYSAEDTGQNRVDRIKEAVKSSFYEARDHLVKFIAFTTILILVFLIFPRLKLLSMAVASLTALALDLVNPKRLTFTKSEDLVNVTISKVFNL